MKTFLNKIHVPNWMVALLAIVLILRIPSFFEPYSYGDEMIYLTLGEGIRQGVTLYSGLHDNKPPLLYVIAALAGNLFWFKAILAFWNLVTIVLFWNLAKALFPEKGKLVKVATIIFALLTSLPLLEGNIANAELFMIGPTIAAFLILLTRKLTAKTLVISGVLFSIAALFKIPAAFDILVIVVFWLIKSEFKKEKVLEVIKNTFYLALGFAAPILATFIFYFFQGAIKEYLVAAFLQNVGYLSSFRPGDIQKPFLIRNGPLLLRGLIVLVGSAILFLRRKRLSEQFIFITIWLLFALFAVTLSERPYPHYLIQALAPMSFLFGMLFAFKSFEQVLVIIPLSLVFAIPVLYKFYYYPTTSYYVRFLNFAFRRISTEQYFSQFDGNVNRNYAVARFISDSTKPGEKIFVSGDAPPIYALSRRLPPIKYVVSYHISDFSTKKDVARQLSEKKPKFIVILPDSPFSEIIPILRQKYILINTIKGAEIWAPLPSASK
jgi:hypothetical protein